MSKTDNFKLNRKHEMFLNQREFQDEFLQAA